MCILINSQLIINEPVMAGHALSASNINAERECNAVTAAIKE
jgi:hypothetical protein